MDSCVFTKAARNVAEHLTGPQDNVLIKQDGSLLVGDWGAAQANVWPGHVCDSCAVRVATSMYNPPECIPGETCSGFALSCTRPMRTYLLGANTTKMLANGLPTGVKPPPLVAPCSGFHIHLWCSGYCLFHCHLLSCCQERL